MHTSNLEELVDKHCIRYLPNTNTEGTNIY